MRENPYLADDITLSYLFEEFEELEEWMLSAKAGSFDSSFYINPSVPRTLYDIKNEQMHQILEAMFSKSKGLSSASPEMDFIAQCRYVLETYQIEVADDAEHDLNGKCFLKVIHGGKR